MPSREPVSLPCLGVVASSTLLLLALGGCGGDGSGIQLPPTTGTLQVTTTTTGDEPDPDGYTVRLDGGEGQAIGVAATIERSELEPRADHTLLLEGLAPNCSVEENPRTVPITAGQTTTTTFAVVCTATSGGVVITTATTGAAPDLDGYSVVLDGVDRGLIPANGQLSLTGLALGSHVVGLSGLAGNCSLQGDNLRAVTVAPGSSATVDYAIACAAPPANAGSLRVITVTTGDNPDSDGYRFSLDRGENQPIQANETATIPNLAAGLHRVQLSGVSDNCRVQGNNARTVSVPGGGSADVTFNVICARAVGSIRVTVFTSGSAADPDGYQVLLDAPPGQAVEPDGSVRFNDVAVGSHTVTLDGVASNCTVKDGASRTVPVTTGSVADVTFRVSCSATGANQLQKVSGDNQEAPAGTKLPQSLVVRILDQNQNPVPNVAVSWVVGDGGGSVDPTTSNTDATGQASTGWTLGPTPGPNTLNAVVSGVGTVTFRANGTGTGTPSTLAVITQPPSSVTVGATLSPAPVVQVRDGQGHDVALAGVEITVGLSQGNGQLNGTKTVATDGNGRAQFNDLSISNGSGTHKLIFAADGFRSATSTKIEVEKASTTTTITSQSSTSSNPGDPVTVSFSVTSPVGTPTGDVEVTASGGGEKCTASVAQGSCDIILTAPGDRTLTATYKGSDVFSSSSSAGVSHSVTQPVNQPPVAVADAYSTGFGQVLNVAAPGVLANDSDPEGGPLTAQLVDSPAQGIVTLNNDGSFTYFPGGVSGTVDTFTYDVSDGNSTNRTTVSITVQ
jgi:hypothetical protein